MFGLMTFACLLSIINYDTFAGIFEPVTVFYGPQRVAQLLSILHASES